MSWTDDIRCLFCDGKLPLYRKITNGQFCSTAHQKGYWQEQERLAVERLSQTHDSLRAYRPKGAVEAILGHPEPEVQTLPEVLAEPATAGLLRPEFAPPQQSDPGMIAADPLAYDVATDFGLQVRRPSRTPPVTAVESVPMADFVFKHERPSPHLARYLVAILEASPLETPWRPFIPATA